MNINLFMNHDVSDHNIALQGTEQHSQSERTQIYGTQ